MKLREKREEWVIEVFKNPPGVTVNHGGDIHEFSEEELLDLTMEYILIRDMVVASEDYEVFMEWFSLPSVYVIYGREIPSYRARIQEVNLGIYEWLPKYMYVKFLKAVCEAVGVEYNNLLLVMLTPPAKGRSWKLEFHEKTELEQIEERTKDLKTRYSMINTEINALERFFKEMKKK